MSAFHAADLHSHVRAQVGDFGLSRLCGRNNATGVVSTAEWGTVPYMAGEYLDNRLMKSSDVYSFGVLLWQMYTGRAPFAGHHEGERGCDGQATTLLYLGLKARGRSPCWKPCMLPLSWFHTEIKLLRRPPHLFAPFASQAGSFCVAGRLCPYIGAAFTPSCPLAAPPLITLFDVSPSCPLAAAQVAFGVMTGDLSLEWPDHMPPPLARLGQACCRHKPEDRPTFKVRLSR